MAKKQTKPDAQAEITAPEPEVRPLTREEAQAEHAGLFARAASLSEPEAYRLWELTNHLAGGKPAAGAAVPPSGA